MNPATQRSAEKLSGAFDRTTLGGHHRRAGKCIDAIIRFFATNYLPLEQIDHVTRRAR